MKTLYETVWGDLKILTTSNRKKALRNAIAKLPEDQQKVLYLHYEKQLSIKEISKQLNFSNTTIYNKLYRGLHTLKMEFNPEAFAKTYKILYPETGKPISY